MAIKDQCANCKKKDTLECSRVIIYDGSPCPVYVRKGINLDKENNVSQPVITPTENSSTSTPPQSRRQRLFAHPFAFKGRIRRLEYGLSVIIFYVLLFVGLEISETSHNSTIKFLGALFEILLFWFWFAQCAKRCHDRGHNGFWQFIPYYRLYLLFAGSEVGANKYGDNPKGRN